MRNKFWHLTLVCLLLATITTDGENKFFNPKGIIVKGTVVNFAGVPYEGANIKLTSKELKSYKNENKIEKQTTTDSKGQYSFTNLPEGSYEVKLESNGTGILEQTVETRLISDGNTYEADFGLEFGSIDDCPLHTVYGTIKNENGKFIEGAKISVINAFNQRRVFSAKTDNKGIYQIDLCNPGQYLIFANTPNYEIQVNSLVFPAKTPLKIVNFILKPFPKR